MLKAAITDYTFDTLDVEAGILGPLGCQIASGQCKSPEELIPLVEDADCIITQFALVTAGVINTLRKAKVIVRYGIGVDNVDLEAAKRKGIPVCNVPDYCVDEVADHTLALILSATRHVMENCLGARGGAWRLAVPVQFPMAGERRDEEGCQMHCKEDRGWLGCSNDACDGPDDQNQREIAHDQPVGKQLSTPERQYEGQKIDCQRDHPDERYSSNVGRYKVGHAHQQARWPGSQRQPTQLPRPTGMTGSRPGVSFRSLRPLVW